MKHIYRLRGLGLAALLVAAACSSGPSDVETLDTPGVDSEVMAADIHIDVIDMDDNGIPNFLVGNIGRVAVKAGFAPVDVERVMFPAFEKAAPFLRVKPEELALTQALTDKEGDQHFRFQQYKNGLPVIGGEVVVHVRGENIIAMNGSARGDLPASLEAKIEHDQIVSAAKTMADRVENLAINQKYELAYKPVGETLTLVYLVEITGELEDGTPVRDTLQVSAEDGSILGRIPHIYTAENREMHNLSGGTTLPGPTVRVEGGAALPMSPANDPINNNYDRLDWVWNTYKNLFARDSYDNAGAKLVSSVHYSVNYVNAYWNGIQMVYGDGDGVNASNLANSMDVTGHELTHAVTEKTSKLIYSGESGGLNEAWSDALGNVVEWYAAGQPATPDANNFKVGEDIWTPGTAGDALRYMCDPAKDGSSADFWTSSVGSLDVHYSSGVPNLAFCLLVKGGTHPKAKSTTVVTGIGMAKAAQIWYKAELIMTSGSTMAQAKTATEQAATQLGYTTAEIASVTAAWTAVGVVSSSGGGGATCSHDKCASGAALTSACNSVVTSVCATDAYCCATSWDSICVAEGRTIGKSLKCSEAKGSCTHNVCTAGATLKNGCDANKANCVSKICAVDAYCCSTSWDAVCIGEVATVCLNNCN